MTSTKCYWKKSGVGKEGLKFIKAKQLGKGSPASLSSTNNEFLEEIISRSLEEKRLNSVVIQYKTQVSNTAALSIHHLLRRFFCDQADPAVENFLVFCTNQMSESDCKVAEQATIDQAGCSLWSELRFGRITASKAHEAAHCKTLDGSLVEVVLGAARVKDNKAMERGRLLEPVVRKEVEKKLNVKILPCGFKTSSNHPIMGASPDGITDQYVIEIKCPISQKSMNTYIKEGKILPKHLAQVHMQMLFFHKRQALFCVAHPDFEITKNVSIVEVIFDDIYCQEIIDKCNIFWKNAIFPMLKNSYN